jgi:antirestriction protein
MMHEKHPYNRENENDPNQQEHPSHEAPQQQLPAIYVASLADYNNGVLHGAWINAARETPEIQADIEAMLAQSPQPHAVEYVIFDYDQFGPCRIHEHDPIDLVAQIARGIREHGHAFAAWADINEGQPDRLEDFTDAYLGHYDSAQDYVDQLVDDLSYADALAKLPESLHPYLRFDTEALARDMELAGDIHPVRDPAGGVWVFRDEM